MVNMVEQVKAVLDVAYVVESDGDTPHRIHLNGLLRAMSDASDNYLDCFNSSGEQIVCLKFKRTTTGWSGNL